MLFFYLRHGEPIYHPDSLTPQGELQAAALANRLAKFGLDKIYTSSSNRAQLTAKPTAEKLGIEPIVLDWANEGHAWHDFALKAPDMEKTTWAFYSPYYRERFNSPEIRKLGLDWADADEFKDLRFAEGIERVRRESDAFFASLGYVHDHERSGYVAEKPNDERVAFFAHHGFGLLFLSILLDIPYPQFSTHFEIGHSGMTVIEFRTSEPNQLCFPKVLQLSNDSHLYREGMSTKYQNRVEF